MKFGSKTPDAIPTTDSDNNFESYEEEVLAHFWPFIGKGRFGGSQNDVSGEITRGVPR